ncbi:MAG: hypothetical protein IJS45_02550 [Clostridia bacterium]|nr:hypothetical protein [Clostridia bacterium]
MNNNRIKSAVQKLSLTESGKARILYGCRDYELTVSKRSPRIKWTLIAAAILILTLTVGVVAAVYLRRAPGENKSHVGIDFELIDFQTDECVIESDDGEFLFKCNNVTGGEERVYLDCTLSKKDGGVITELSSDGVELPIIDVTGSVKLTNGDERPVLFFTLSDSTETEYHIEGWVLMAKHLAEGTNYDEYQDNKYYNADEIKGLLDGATLAPGMIAARTVNTKAITLSADAQLSTCEPGVAVPNSKDRFVYDNYGNKYLLSDQLECSLDVGNMDIPFSADGSITVDNCAFGPYHHHHADLSELTALYINIKGYEDNGLTFEFYSSDGTKLPYIGAVIADPAPGIKTLVVYDSYTVEDMTLERFSQAYEMRSVQHDSETLCTFSSGVKISADFKNEVVDTSFDPVIIALDNGQIVLNSAHMTNTYIRLLGTCVGLGELDLALDEAYVVTDSVETVMLGSKHGVGTDKDGVTFSIEWQCETVIDPEKIAEIHVNGTVIKLK